MLESPLPYPSAAERGTRVSRRNFRQGEYLQRRHALMAWFLIVYGPKVTSARTIGPEPLLPSLQRERMWSHELPEAMSERGPHTGRSWSCCSPCRSSWAARHLRQTAGLSRCRRYQCPTGPIYRGVKEDHQQTASGETSVTRTWYDTPFTVMVAEYKRSCTLVKPKPVESDPLDTETGYVLAGARLSSVAAED